MPHLPHANSGLLAWLARLGGPGLLLYAVADGSFVPMPPGGADLPTLLLAASHPAAWPYYALMATLGGLLGGLLAYQVAATAGADKLAAKVGPARIAAVRRRGWSAVLAGAILPAPFPYKAVPLAAGAARLPRSQFLAALALGRGLRFGLAAYVGAHYGRAALRWLRRAQPTPPHLAIAAALTLACAAAVWLFWRRRRTSSAGAARNARQPGG